METQTKTAIILGATGLTGGILLQLLLNDNRYNRIKLFSRSTIGFAHEKMEEHLGDLMNLDQFKDHFQGEEVFCCIGTTKSKTPNKEQYRTIDYGIPVSAAKLCNQNNISTFVVVSAMGANAKSSVFYNRVKGEMEDAVLDAKITETYFLQPSLIGGKRNEKRVGEWLFKQFMKVVNLVLAGPLEKYRSIKPETIAKAMVWLANNEYKTNRIESDIIKKIAAKSD
ncbi:NAD(P)H-binding protein [Aurantibacter crassamenti]|uniref:NAD(P)H-binding protein n=1 Tax=Aurantibacter crassamenti TaxID=1837375 RepID=UPI00193ABA6D|nr:NAD(P)H-binding protein [Aurantibacter crassamenti]MBM1104974.1 NAD(P)H-binding protein [Aurantibacter crassamenti]